MGFRFLKGWILVVLLWPLVCLAGGLNLDGKQASLSLASHVEILEDPAGTLQVQDLASPAVAARFAPAQVSEGSEINFGYSASVYWLRFDLAGQGADRDWLLEVAFPSLDRLDFFMPGLEGFVGQQTGDLQPFADRPFAHRNFVFPFRLPAGEARTHYLRVESKGSLTLPLRLWQPDAFALHNQGVYATLSLYYGILLALGAYNLLLYSVVRERAYLFYVAFVACMAIGQLSLNGFGNQFLWPDWPAWGNVALVVGFNGAGLFGALFTRRFLETRKSPRFNRLITLLAIGFALSGLAPAVLPYRWVAIITSLLGVSFAVSAVAAGVASWRRGHPGARWFLLAWLVLLVGVAAMGLRNLAWLPTNFFSSNAMQIGSALEMLLLSFALADRINTLLRDKEAAQAEALRARQREIEALQYSERELEARVAVRTRALAEANERLRKTEELLRHRAHHDPLTGLPNRMLLEDRLSHAMRKAERQRTLVAVLLIDLDGFKPVNDLHGHAAGDAVLVELSDRFQKAVRASDTVARMGGDEFVIVLDDLKAREHAFAIAEKIVDAAQQPVEVDGCQLQLGASVGVAFWPEDGSQADELLQRADAAMYMAKNAGRCRFEVARGGEGQPLG